MQTALGLGAVVPPTVTVLAWNRAVGTPDRGITLGNERMERQVMVTYEGIPLRLGDIE